MALVESSVGLVVEMETAHGRAALRAIAEPQRLNGHLSARPLMRPLAELDGPPMSRLPDLPSKPGSAASELRSLVSVPSEPSASFPVEGLGFETSDISEIRAESLMSASFVGRLAADVSKPFADPAKEVEPPEERVPTLIGREESGELATSAGPEPRLGGMIPDLGEDETHPPPDEMTMHAEAAEMTLEPFDDPSYGDDTESKQFNEQTPHLPFEEKKKDSLTDEEIEGMLSELEDVVDLGRSNEDGSKAKRRTRKAR